MEYDADNTYDHQLLLRLLNEGVFWKQQEAEHADLLRVIAPDLEPHFSETLQLWEQALSQTQAKFVRYIETISAAEWSTEPIITAQLCTEIKKLAQYARLQSGQFVGMLARLGTESKAYQQNATAIVVLNHNRRESEYYIGRASRWSEWSPALSN